MSLSRGLFLIHVNAAHLFSFHLVHFARLLRIPLCYPFVSPMVSLRSNSSVLPGPGAFIIKAHSKRTDVGADSDCEPSSASAERVNGQTGIGEDTTQAANFFRQRSNDRVAQCREWLRNKLWKSCRKRSECVVDRGHGCVKPQRIAKRRNEEG